jgi:hypothetical protein
MEIFMEIKMEIISDSYVVSWDWLYNNKFVSAIMHMKPNSKQNHK